MPDAADAPTPYPEVNALVMELLESVQAVLNGHFIGMYLDGSLANGGFDQDSDIDFVVVSDEEVSESLFTALQAMHERLSLSDSPFAFQLEGSYLSSQALRRYDPALSLHPNIERGQGERLKWARHDEAWMVHRSVLRERGICLAGPDPQRLIDPVSPDALRWAMRALLSGWVTQLRGEAPPSWRGGQSYIVLSLCRVLVTLEHGQVVSKAAAARWAQETLDKRWGPLIEGAWEGRHQPGLAVSAQDGLETQEFVRYCLERGRQIENRQDSERQRSL